MWALIVPLYLVQNVCAKRRSKLSSRRCCQRKFRKSVYVWPSYVQVLLRMFARVVSLWFYCVCVQVCASANLIRFIFVQFVYKTGATGIFIRQLDIIASVYWVSYGQFQWINMENFAHKKHRDDHKSASKDRQQQRKEDGWCWRWVAARRQNQ